MHGVIPAKLAKQQQTPRLPRVGKRAALLAGAAFIGAAAVWYGWSWWTVGRFIQSTDDAYVGGDVTAIASKVAGFVQTVAITDNQAVKAGRPAGQARRPGLSGRLATRGGGVAAQQAPRQSRRHRRLQLA